MTLDEKVAQLGGAWVTELVADDRLDVERARVRLRHGTGHVTRIGAATDLRPAARAQLLNDIQRILVENPRLGIAAVVHEQSVGGLCAQDATVFPHAIGLAATCDPALVEAVASVSRERMLATGARQTLAPVLDVARDPRWGRVEETYGEDPYLAGVLGTAYVRGLQTDDLGGGVVCTGKHFLAYGLPEGGMNHAPVHVGPRELREVFAEPFAAAIRDAGLASVMNSYSSVAGLPCAGAAEILTRLLRDELGFDGVVVADYFAVALLEFAHRTAASKREAARQALEAGLDLELPAFDCYRELAALVAAGEVSETLVDRSARRVLRPKRQLARFERPYADAVAAARAYDTAEQRALARTVAARSCCLLTNSGVLPLGADLRTIAVVGPTADDPRLLQGDYHYPAHLEIMHLPAEAHCTPHVTPLAAIRDAVGPRTRLRYARGCDVRDPDPRGIADAVGAARDADVAVVCVVGGSGLTGALTAGEARYATDLILTVAVSELHDCVVATG